MKVYLAGPMRGIPQHNYPAFDAAAERLRAAGHEVFSPADHDRQAFGKEGADATSFSLRAALGADLAWICAHADAVALLPGWGNSKGAAAERATAIALGLRVFEVAS